MIQNMISIIRGDDTDFNGNNLVKFVLDTNVDLSSFKAYVYIKDIGYLRKLSIVDKTITLNFDKNFTKTLRNPLYKSFLKLEDSQGRFYTVYNFALKVLSPFDGYNAIVRSTKEVTIVLGNITSQDETYTGDVLSTPSILTSDVNNNLIISDTDDIFTVNVIDVSAQDETDVDETDVDEVLTTSSALASAVGENLIISDTDDIFTVNVV